MISFVFGVKVDMRVNGAFKPALDTYLGNIATLGSVSGTKVEATTTSGNKVTLRGDFNFNNESDLRSSDMTGFELKDKSGHVVVSVQGIPNTQFNDLDGSSADWMGEINRAMRAGFSLASGAGADVILGLGGNDVLISGAGNDRVSGGAGNDRISAGAGNDTLDGGLGIDSLNGGAGNDLYVVDNLKDRVVELASGGTDSVRSSANWTMAINVEKLILTGSKALHAIGNAGHNTITGNSGANLLDGRGGNDLLNGGLGADTMKGGAGNDQYFVERAADKVVELAGQGTDKVLASIDFTLPANVERLTLTGSAHLDGTGNGLDNIIVGNAGNNVIAGGAGNDTLTGGAGADDFVFGHFGLANADTITDFLSGTDDLFLDPAVFTALSTGVLDPGQMRLATDVADGNDFLVYDQASDLLSYDASGDGSGPLQAIVTLDGLVASDIHVGVI